jgi:uncharacterized protein YbcV (DUF1398 family)
MNASNSAITDGESASQHREVASTAKQVIEECARASHAATITFAEAVVRLASVGVESYFADFRRGTTTYYLSTGASHAVLLHTPEPAVPEPFDAGAIVEAIRGSQRGEVKYPEFVRRAMASGCVGYFVWIKGRHVRYLGRRGEDHTEHFPQ